MTSASEPLPNELQNSSDSPTLTELEREVSRRRTFAIISHPDAGKTTLTEKLLLYAGAIELAGAVRGRKARRHATSDWMALEQERGISMTSAALEFDLEGRRMALLDTPGHRDFSEDTYRALIAADSVVMVIDAAKGVEDQTRKLFEVSQRHRLPILTFVNKLDHPSRDPMELLDDLERTLGIAAAPVNWPVGSADTFRGVYDLHREDVAPLRAGGAGAASRAGRSVGAARSGRARLDWRGPARAPRRGAGPDRCRRHALRPGANTWPDARRPVFFGSALDELRARAVPAGARRARAVAAAAPERLGDRRARPTSGSADSCSRFKRTWIRGIGIASPSSASVPDGSRRTWCC